MRFSRFFKNQFLNMEADELTARIYSENPLSKQISGLSLNEMNRNFRSLVIIL